MTAPAQLVGLCALLPFVLPSPAQGPVPRSPKVTFVEGFGTGTDTGNWTFFGNPVNPVEVIEPSGGHPGAFLHSACDGLGCLDTFAPEFHTQAGVDSVFTGDYRANGVVSLGIDVAIFGPELVSTDGHPLTLMLVSDGGTPDVFDDDVSVFVRTRRNIPAANGNWRSYSFRVPSRSVTLPPRWTVLQGTGDADADWNSVMSHVSQVIFFFGDPQLFYFFQLWDLGVDNVRISLDPPQQAVKR